ncbi:hypothetical protein Pmani_037317 [Petrolisthes manimaculis]|uniref:Uncharacterized protein n=1 Tax=Petrolisthes manimaculis TaxID=1843537 RepID=A0AAE1TLJ9_9EUCA|nr:hypothetical protein Pmani_037317 [Petrolisthes manimaculis]
MSCKTEELLEAERWVGNLGWVVDEEGKGRCGTRQLYLPPAPVGRQFASHYSLSCYQTYDEISLYREEKQVGLRLGNVTVAWWVPAVIVDQRNHHKGRGLWSMMDASIYPYEK